MNGKRDTGLEDPRYTAEMAKRMRGQALAMVGVSLLAFTLAVALPVAIRLFWLWTP